jgi:hypothetical protein
MYVIVRGPQTDACRRRGAARWSRDNDPRSAENRALDPKHLATSLWAYVSATAPPFDLYELTPDQAYVERGPRVRGLTAGAC